MTSPRIFGTSEFFRKFCLAFYFVKSSHVSSSLRLPRRYPVLTVFVFVNEHKALATLDGLLPHHRESPASTKRGPDVTTVPQRDTAICVRAIFPQARPRTPPGQATRVQRRHTRTVCHVRAVRSHEVYKESRCDRGNPDAPFPGESGTRVAHRGTRRNAGALRGRASYERVVLRADRAEPRRRAANDTPAVRMRPPTGNDGRHLATSLALLLAVLAGGSHCLEVIYAVNAGGDRHVDSHGIRYAKDPLTGRVGTASDYGKQLIIGRVSLNDQILYQTERYHHSTFGYDIPISKNGDYVMILKFCEVYFNSPNMKVFDVVLNGDHTVVTDLDIFERVGRGVAHDEYVPFRVQDGKLIYNDEESDILAGKIRVEFIKGYRDNPKINAIVVIKGTLDDIPQLEPVPQNPEELYAMPEEEEETVRSRHTSGPRTPDPYSIEDSSVMLPVFVAIGAFIPLLFCLCKL